MGKLGLNHLGATLGQGWSKQQLGTKLGKFMEQRSIMVIILLGLIIDFRFQ